jgi:O-antigen/teichoic acid export membrane protein
MASGAPATGKRLAGDAAMLAAAALLTQGAGLVGTVALARILPIQEFGSYQQLLLLYGIVAPLLFGGVPAALTYFLARAESDEERRGWAFDGIVALAVLGALFGVLLVILRHPLAELLNGDSQLAAAIGLLAPYAVLTFVAAATPNALIPVGRASLSARLSAVSALVYVALIVIAAAVHPDVRALSVAMGISGAFSATLGVVAVGRAIGYRVRWHGLSTRAGRFLRYGIPLALTGLAGLLGFQFDRLVISARYSPEVYAVYAVGAVELPLTAIVQQSINSVLLPELTVRHRDGDLPGVAALWRETIRKTSLIILPLFVLFLILADDLVRLVFGPRFEDSVAIFRIYLLLMPLRVATYGIIPMAIGRTRINLVASLVVLGSNVVLALALVGPLGLKGPAWATVIATALTAVYYIVRLRGLLGLSIGTLFPWRQLGGNLAVAAAAGLPLLAIAAAPWPHVVTLVVGGIAYTLVVVAALRVTGRLNDDDWARLRAVARRARGRA